MTLWLLACLGPHHGIRGPAVHGIPFSVVWHLKILSCRNSTFSMLIKALKMQVSYVQAIIPEESRFSSLHIEYLNIPSICKGTVSIMNSCFYVRGLKQRALLLVQKPVLHFVIAAKQNDNFLKFCVE